MLIKGPVYELRVGAVAPSTPPKPSKAIVTVSVIQSSKVGPHGLLSKPQALL